MTAILAALCAYALMLSPAASEPALTPIARCENFLRFFELHGESHKSYRRISVTEQVDPLKVTIEFEIRNKAHAPHRLVASCEFYQDRRHIGFITLDGSRSQIIYD
ncbi:hypothetical protein FKO01_13185 [Mesorhizobium sp. B2-3-3]|uniref:hypothetical protein n=1 Tax=Mesorhizobium sp. B2-3-5 TaxID=2589958 RepID=UPI001129095F|nr:hypothetical protein [Mesorhizobium sp. B2-3-5]TPM34918.1 hypothetical protein FJ958_07455 [Mesorhizobium sp. B2-3-5]TPN33120.1 hypothetical protein FKO01_13185 [Mesorhizobium sp. B2-3-3]